MSEIIIDYNPIDRKWKVLEDAFVLGDGETIKEAVASARTVTDKQINFNGSPFGIVEFEFDFKAETISGYFDNQDINDDAPLNFYDDKGFEIGTNIPKNPHHLNSLVWNDYHYLTVIIRENDIVDLLCQYFDQSKTIVLEETEYDGPVLLKINGGE